MSALTRTFRWLSLITLLLTGSSCVTPQNFTDRSDAGRRKQILGHWYDQYMQGANYASGDTQYHSNGTFAATYKSVVAGSSEDKPSVEDIVKWSGKWRIESGTLIEDITQTSDAARTPADRPLIRSIGILDAQRLVLRSEVGNVNTYARKRPQPPKVKFTPLGGE